MPTIPCPACARPLSIRDEYAGKQVRCSACQKVFLAEARTVPSITSLSVPSAAGSFPVEGEEATDGCTLPPDPLSDETRNAAFAGTPPADEMLDFLGTPQAADELGRLGGYRILKVLGQGGMGVVLLAEDAKLRRKVAIKAMLPQMAHSHTGRGRFLREAEAAASLEHDHIVPILHVGEDRGAPYIVMPFLKGEPLDARMKRPVPLSLVLRVGIEAADALAVAHERGLIHRDIKPANIWLEERTSGEPRVKLLDFGLARLTQTSDQEHLTQTGAILGTPGYMPPEQVDGRELDGRADLFSLGCVLYALATGKPAFGGASITARLLAVSLDRPTPPAQVEPAVPLALSELIMQLVARNREDRPATAQEVGRRLVAIERTLLSEAPTDVQAPPAKPMGSPSAKRPRRRWPVLVGGGLLAALAVLAGVIVIKIKNKDGSETKIEVPKDGTVIVEKDGKVVADVRPEKDKEPPAGVPWKPIPAGKSPFDKLDAKEIPAAERFAWQPKELVAVIGSHVRRHWGFVNAVAISPDGKLAASHSSGGTDSLIVWDMATQRAKWVLRVSYQPHAGSVVFGPDSKTLYCLQFGNFLIFDLTGDPPTRKEFALSSKPDEKNGAWDWHYAHLCEDGKSLVVWGLDDKLAVFDLAGGKPKLVETKTKIRGPVLHGGAVAIVVGNQLIYASPEWKLRRVTIKDAKFDKDEELPIKLGEKEYPRAVSPDGKRLALWDKDHLDLWDISQKPPKLVQKLEGQNSVTFDGLVFFSPDGRWMATKYTHTALWRIDGDKPRFAGWLDQACFGSVGAVAFSRDGKRAVMGNSSGFVRFWDLSGAEPKELSPFDPDTAFINANGSGTALDSPRGRVMLWRYDRPGAPRFQLWDLTQASPRPYPDAKTFLDPDGGGFVYSVAKDRWVQIASFHNQKSRRYALRDGRWQPDGETFGEPNVLGEASRDGRFLVLADGAKGWRLEGYDLTAAPTKKWTVSLKDRMLGQYLERVWFAADSRRFLVRTTKGKDGPVEMTVWQNTGPKPEMTATIPTKEVGNYRAALSRDGRYLTHTKNSFFVVEDLSEQKPREIAQVGVEIVGGQIFGLAYSPDGRHLACGTHLGVVIFETKTWKPVWRWKDAPGNVLWVEFADDGRHLFTHNANGTVYVLRLKDLATP